MPTISSSQLKRDWLAWQSLRRTHPEKFALRSTGLQSLDTALGGGIELGQFILIGAPPKAGKTTLLVQIKQAFERQGVLSIYFSAEMTNNQIGNLVFSSLSGVKRKVIRAADWTDEDWKSMEEAGCTLETWPGYWNYGFSTLADIKKEIAFVEEKTNDVVKAIFVDYLQLMNHPAENRWAAIEAITHGLKHLSIQRQEPMAVVANAQLTRESIKQHVQEMHSFYGGGAMERDMDVGIMIDSVLDNSGNPILNKKKISIVGAREVEPCAPFAVGYDGDRARIFDDTTVASFEMNTWT